MDVKVPQKFASLFYDKPNERIMTRVCYGGRGSGKTQGFVQMMVCKAIEYAIAGVRGTILCAREYMVSIPQSTLKDIKSYLGDNPEYAKYFEIGERVLRTSTKLQGRVDFSFIGLDSNLESLKGFSNVLICFIDEGETVKEDALIMLEPSLRANGTLPNGKEYWSELWIAFNPRREDSAVWRHYVIPSETESTIKCIKMNADDNPYFTSNPNLMASREKARRIMDASMYRWVWEGDFLKESDIQVLRGKIRVSEFEPDVVRWSSYIGLDWGFSQDPSAAVLAYINPKEPDTLYVRAETGGTGIAIELHPSMVVDAFEDYIAGGVESHTVYADHLPSNVDYCRRHGLSKIVNAYKPKVNDGVMVLRQFEKIVIHPSCKQLIEETDLYSFKQRPNGDVTTDIVDKYNHYIDALRYALTPLMKSKIEAGKGNNSVGLMKPASNRHRYGLGRR